MKEEGERVPPWLDQQMLLKAGPLHLYIEGCKETRARRTIFMDVLHLPGEGIQSFGTVQLHNGLNSHMHRTKDGTLNTV